VDLGCAFLDDGPCKTAICDLESGECITINLTHSLAVPLLCSDGLACTTGQDICYDGGCLGVTQDDNFCQDKLSHSERNACKTAECEPLDDKKDEDGCIFYTIPCNDNKDCTEDSCTLDGQCFHNWICVAPPVTPQPTPPPQNIPEVVPNSSGKSTLDDFLLGQGGALAGGGAGGGGGGGGAAGVAGNNAAQVIANYPTTTLVGGVGILTVGAIGVFGAVLAISQNKEKKEIPLEALLEEEAEQTIAMENPHFQEITHHVSAIGEHGHHAAV